MDNDRIEGAAKNIGGKIKEGVGKLTGDAKLQTEGKLDQAEGKAQNAVGGIKDKVRETTAR
ncbi:CsbD family protein [Sandaracinobacteroides saxicola]|uniref:CsbD family protein n=1 Tax=Sandaracinobacteroides saxicola TaxID=2759707 RepID=A0A7G5IEA2_9SPHN|nr:CsbD family protein [Sandaracinobacteroides saxicola]QMW21694.1 CsbD family protein [Sandaracinobacteroides saxicola]